MSTTTDPEIDTTIRSGSIAVAVDGSHSADQAISWAAEEARLTQRPLTIVHVERALGAQEHGWLAQAGVSLPRSPRSCVRAPRSSCAER